MSDEARRLSKLLFDARELIEMYADHLTHQHVPDSFPRRIVAELDAYRAERGWSPDGFGGES